MTSGPGCRVESPKLHISDDDLSTVTSQFVGLLKLAQIVTKKIEHK